MISKIKTVGELKEFIKNIDDDAPVISTWEGQLVPIVGITNGEAFEIFADGYFPEIKESWFYPQYLEDINKKLEDW